MNLDIVKELVDFMDGVNHYMQLFGYEGYKEDYRGGIKYLVVNIDSHWHEAQSLHALYLLFY